MQFIPREGRRPLQVKALPQERDCPSERQVVFLMRAGTLTERLFQTVDGHAAAGFALFDSESGCVAQNLGVNLERDFVFHGDA
jgi:hypothetical protein